MPSLDERIDAAEDGNIFHRAIFARDLKLQGAMQKGERRMEWPVPS